MLVEINKQMNKFPKTSQLGNMAWCSELVHYADTHSLSQIQPFRPFSQVCPKYHETAFELSWDDACRISQQDNYTASGGTSWPHPHRAQGQKAEARESEHIEDTMAQNEAAIT